MSYRRQPGCGCTGCLAGLLLLALMLFTPALWVENQSLREEVRKRDERIQSLAAQLARVRSEQ